MEYQHTEHDPITIPSAKLYILCIKFNDIGIVNIGGVYIATPARAIADTLYFNPQKHFDAPVDWTAVQDIASKVGYNIPIPK